MTDILLLNGPNLNLLGVREPDKYGNDSLEKINKTLMDKSREAKISFSHFQSNSESQLIERIHLAYQEKTKFIIFNPAAYTHTSIALRDALLATNIQFIELHLSNIYAREKYRHKSFFSDIAFGIISGFGAYGYELALKSAIRYCCQNNKTL